MKAQLHAILMGDLVGSSLSKDTRALSKSFNAEIKALNQKFKLQIESPLTITLGDEFQGIVKDMPSAFEAALKANLDFMEQGNICRFVIAHGWVETKINRSSSWNMMGNGLKEARKRLSDKRDDNRFRFIVPDKQLEAALNGLGMALTKITDAWTSHQLKIVRAATEISQTKTSLAKSLAINRSALYKTLNSSNLKLYEYLTSSVARSLGENIV